MVSGKGTSKPYVQFLGNSAISVAGSINLVRFKKYAILLDCGLAQGFDIATGYKTNKDMLKKLRCKEIDWIILSHIHADHGSLVPALFAKGCQAHVFIPRGSVPFLKLLWEDSAKIMEQDCLKLQHKHGMKATPFYTQVDIERALNRVIEVDFNTPHFLTEDISFTYYSAGHIIHSAQIYLELREGSVIKRVGYACDIGTGTKVYTTKREALPFVNLLVGESTYNVPTRPNKTADYLLDAQKIISCSSQFHKLLFPCFSLQRTQVILNMLYKLDIHEIKQIYLDSPLATKFCAMWSDSEEWTDIMSKVKTIETPEQSRALQMSNEPCIIISASGFLNGGRVLNHLKTVLPSSKNVVMFCGFAGENNLASQIKSKQPSVNIDGEEFANRANIVELRSFSSHCSYEELIDYYSNECRYDKIALVHGEYEGKVKFYHALQDILISQGKSSRVVCTNQDTKVYI